MARFAWLLASPNLFGPLFAVPFVNTGPGAVRESSVCPSTSKAGAPLEMLAAQIASGLSARKPPPRERIAAAREIHRLGMGGERWPKWYTNQRFSRKAAE